MIPKSRLEVLKWCKFYYEMDPYVHSYIDAAAQSIHCLDEKIGKEINCLVQAMVSKILLEGECFPIKLEYGITFIDSRLIEVRQTVFQQEKTLWLISGTTDTELIEYALINIKGSSDMLKEAAKEGLLLNKEMGVDISHILVKYTPSDVRGHSIIMPYIKRLMYNDKLKIGIADEILWKEIQEQVLKIMPRVEEWFKKEKDMDIKLMSIIKK